MFQVTTFQPALTTLLQQNAKPNQAARGTDGSILYRHCNPLSLVCMQEKREREREREEEEEEEGGRPGQRERRKKEKDMPCAAPHRPTKRRCPAGTHTEEEKRNPSRPQEQKGGRRRRKRREEKPNPKPDRRKHRNQTAKKPDIKRIFPDNFGSEPPKHKAKT